MVSILVFVGACLVALAAGFWLGLLFTGRASGGGHRFHDPAVSVQATIARATADDRMRPEWRE
ncbi:hypothetical protein [Amycolatopsis aidingensis]|uniref:hypothetical protein n=1 Tax=Amycolatopsis aidingensis TaxID=2842453 RepID=UPI001C0B8EC2|nr:hypothetical protein [Amycolatopsis aidingensis]